MLFPELSGIKLRRQKIGIKQKELAKIAGISQSLIAKLESNKISPSYDVVKRLFIALDSLEHKNEKKCCEIMQTKIIYVQKKDRIQKAIDLMKKNSISQMPVYNGKEVVGSISEATIYDKVMNGLSKKLLVDLRIEEIMNEAFPVINADYPVSAAMPLLKSSQAILLTKDHKIQGIITKSSLF
jgi:predicted transcriptional regulator